MESPESVTEENITNLKIIVDNTENISESSSKEEGELSQDDSDDEMKDVEVNVYLGDVAKTLEKRYENKPGNFITGIDFSSEDSRRRRIERAKRFGLDVKSVRNIDCTSLYKSLDLSEEHVNSAESDIRKEAIHFWGLNNMNTSDVFTYFQDYGPAEIEWINDSSCNVLWEDVHSATRAMLHLSEPINFDENDNDDNIVIMDTTEEKLEKETDEEKNSEKKADEEDLTLDLTKDSETLDLAKNSENKSDLEKDLEDTADVIMLDDDDDDADEKEDKTPKHADIKKRVTVPQLEKKGIIMPPGRWRLGTSYPRANVLLMRFATTRDKKEPGSERRSLYYKKHGNPNYLGMTGVISESKRKQIRYAQQKRELEQILTKEDKPPSPPAEFPDREQNDLDRPAIDLREPLVPITAESFVRVDDKKRPKRPVRERIRLPRRPVAERLDLSRRPALERLAFNIPSERTRTLSSSSVEEVDAGQKVMSVALAKRLGDRNSLDKRKRKRKRHSEESEHTESDTSDMEVEVKQLLGEAKSKRIKRRMYADEIEDEIKTLRKQTNDIIMITAASAPSDIKSKIKSNAFEDIVITSDNTRPRRKTNESVPGTPNKNVSQRLGPPVRQRYRHHSAESGDESSSHDLEEPPLQIDTASSESDNEKQEISKNRASVHQRLAASPVRRSPARRCAVSPGQKQSPIRHPQSPKTNRLDVSQKTNNFQARDGSPVFDAARSRRLRNAEFAWERRPVPQFRSGNRGRVLQRRSMTPPRLRRPRMIANKSPSPNVRRRREPSTPPRFASPKQTLPVRRSRSLSSRRRPMPRRSRSPRPQSDLRNRLRATASDRRQRERAATRSENQKRSDVEAREEKREAPLPLPLPRRIKREVKEEPNSSLESSDSSDSDSTSSSSSSSSSDSSDEDGNSAVNEPARQKKNTEAKRTQELVTKAFPSTMQVKASQQKPPNPAEQVPKSTAKQTTAPAGDKNAKHVTKLTKPTTEKAAADPTKTKMTKAIQPGRLKDAAELVKTGQSGKTDKSTTRKVAAEPVRINPTEQATKILKHTADKRTTKQAESTSSKAKVDTAKSSIPTKHHNKPGKTTEQHKATVSKLPERKQLQEEKREAKPRKRRGSMTSGSSSESSSSSSSSSSTSSSSSSSSSSDSSDSESETFDI